MMSLSPKRVLAILGLGLFVLYTLFQARYLILGPEVRIASPTDGEVFGAPLVTVSGTALNAAFISLDDRPIFVDEAGRFEEKLLLPPGQSSIIVKARDRFGRETEKIVRVVLNE